MHDPVELPDPVKEHRSLVIAASDRHLDRNLGIHGFFDLGLLPKQDHLQACVLAKARNLTQQLCGLGVFGQPGSEFGQAALCGGDVVPDCPALGHPGLEAVPLGPQSGELRMVTGDLVCLRKMDAKQVPPGQRGNGEAVHQEAGLQAQIKEIVQHMAPSRSACLFDKLPQLIGFVLCRLPLSSLGRQPGRGISPISHPTLNHKAGERWRAGRHLLPDRFADLNVLKVGRLGQIMGEGGNRLVVNRLPFKPGRAGALGELRQPRKFRRMAAQIVQNPHRPGLTLRRHKFLNKLDFLLHPGLLLLVAEESRGMLTQGTQFAFQTVLLRDESLGLARLCSVQRAKGAQACHKQRAGKDALCSV